MSEELAAIRQLLQDIVSKQAVHASEQNQIKEDVEQIKHVLIEGNGTPAMTVRLAVAENELARIKEDRDDKKMPRSAWVAIVLSSILALASIAASYS